MSVVFEDNNASLERSDMAIYIGQKRVWDTKNTTKFYVTGREGDGACMRVEKDWREHYGQIQLRRNQQDFQSRGFFREATKDYLVRCRIQNEFDDSKQSIKSD